MRGIQGALDPLTRTWKGVPLIDEFLPGSDPEGMTSTRRKQLRVGGAWVDEDRFIRNLQAGSDAAARRVIRQIRDDRAHGGSTGLVLLSQAFRVRVVSFQARILGGDHGAAKEAWNDALLDIWEGIDGYDPRLSKFRTWVYNTARYRALARKRQLDRRTPPSGSPDPGGISLSGQLPEPLTAAEGKALRRAYRRLKETERELLWYRFVEGWMPAEIVRTGLVQGVGEKSIRVYINRATSRLKDLYENELGSQSTE